MTYYIFNKTGEKLLYEFVKTGADEYQSYVHDGKARVKMKMTAEELIEFLEKHKTKIDIKTSLY